MKKSRVPVIITTISTSLPHRRRSLFLNHTISNNIISTPSHTTSSSNATALADDDGASESESESKIVADPQTPPKQKKGSKKAPVAKAEKLKQSNLGKVETKKRSHSVTLVSSGGKSDSLPRNVSPKRARFADESDSSIEIGEVTPAPKSKSAVPSLPKTRAAKGATVVSKAKSVQYKSKAYVDSEEDTGDEGKDTGPAATSSSMSLFFSLPSTHTHSLQSS